MSLVPEAAAERQDVLVPRYDLDDNTLDTLTSELLHERPPTSDAPIICYSIEQDSRYANIARTVEREVFERYFGNTAEQMSEEYGPYEAQSRFLLSVDQETGKPAGVLRVIENGEAGLKTLNDLEVIGASDDPRVPHITIDAVTQTHAIETLDDTWDIGTVAVRKPYRATTDTSVQLYRAMYVSAMEADIKHFVSIIDAKPLQRMTDYLGIPFVPMVDSQPFSYLGSEASQAVYGDVTKFYEKMNRRRKTVKGFLARKALTPLVKGTKDSALHL